MGYAPVMSTAVVQARARQVRGTRSRRRPNYLRRRPNYLRRRRGPGDLWRESLASARDTGIVHFALRHHRQVLRLCPTILLLVVPPCCFRQGAMAGGGCWPGHGPGSLSFRLHNPLGIGASSLGPARAAQGDAVLGDDGATPKPRKSLRSLLKAALTASVLATTGDTVAQVTDRYKKRKALADQRNQGVVAGGVVGATGLLNQATDGVSLWDHDWQRAARMASYGFLIYGPLSQVWYEILDHFMPVKNLTNLSLKVVANQVILGPIVITLVFAWNKLWEGRLEQLPDLYRTRALQTLLDGWKFWIPASVLNFGVIPLQTRVAFMSSCSIFWNFYLSNTMQGKGKALPASKSI